MNSKRWWGLGIAGAVLVLIAIGVRLGADEADEPPPQTVGVPFPLVAFAVQSLSDVREVSPAADRAPLPEPLILEGFTFAAPTDLLQSGIVGTVTLLECDLVARSLAAGEELTVTFWAGWHAALKSTPGRELTGRTTGRLTLVAEHGAASADDVSAFAHSELARLVVGSLESELRAAAKGR